jgi:hypothetical protein
MHSFEEAEALPEKAYEMEKLEATEDIPNECSEDM